VGFFFGADAERALGEDLTPTITAGEYLEAMTDVIQELTESPRDRCHMCIPGIRALAAGFAGRATLVFSTHVRRHLSDEHTYRLLGLAHLTWGNDRLAVKHLEIALGLLRRRAVRAISLRDKLRLQCEAALLRTVLIRLYSRLGEVQAVRWLVREGEELL
jgi:hypothetical protein